VGHRACKGERRNAHKIVVDESESKIYLEYLWVDGRIMLKLTLKW
jgi:hypothetical protein